MQQREANLGVIKLTGIGPLDLGSQSDGGGVNNVNGFRPGPMPSSHVLVHPAHGPAQRGVPVLPIHIGDSVPGLVSNGNAIGLHVVGLLLHHLLHRHDLAVGGFHLVQLLHEVPETRLRTDIVRGKNPHAVYDWVRIGFARELAACHEVLPQLHRETGIAFHHLFRKEIPKMYGTKRSVTPGLMNKRRYASMADQEMSSDKEIEIQDKGEESKEVTAYLSVIRKRHDKIKQENMRKKEVLERLKKEYAQLTEIAQNDEENSGSIETQIENVKVVLESTGNKFKAEIKDRKTYEYILDRMKKNKIAMELKANSIQISLKSTKHVLNSEIKKSQRVRENQYQSRMILSDMRTTFSQHRRKKTEYLQNLERELKSREDIADRREDRQKRQLEIAEAAANEDKDSQEVKQREALLLFKLWYNFLSRKLTCEMKQAIDLERAFSKIKSATGLSDVVEIVEKFLTREQNYFMLINAVTEAERKLGHLRMENLKAKDALDVLQFEEGRNRNEGKDVGGVERKLAWGHKHYANLREKVKDAVRRYDQLLTWIEKMMMVLNMPALRELEEVQVKLTRGRTRSFQGEQYSLKGTFDEVFEGLVSLTAPIKVQTEKSKQDMKAYSQMKTSEIVAEMSTDEALTKLVRVRIESIGSDEDDTESVPDNREARTRNMKKSRINKDIQ